MSSAYIEIKLSGTPYLITVLDEIKSLLHTESIDEIIRRAIIGSFLIHPEEPLTELPKILSDESVHTLRAPTIIVRIPGSLTKRFERHVQESGWELGVYLANALSVLLQIAKDQENVLAQADQTGDVQAETLEVLAI